MALGVSMPDGRNMNALDDFISDVDATPALWSVWSQWGATGNKKECYPNPQGSCAFPRATLEDLHDRDITGVVWWEPVKPGASFQQNQRYGRHKKTYAEKKNTKYIRQWAREARDFGRDTGRKVIVRLAHEANGKFFPWTIGHWDNTNATFKRFWRYVYQQFKRVGAAKHVDFFWSMNKKKCGCNPFKVIWPGAKYVDYVGFTAFNWGNYQNKSWKSMVKVLQQPMNQLGKVTKKRVIVGELASNHRGGDKEAWIKNGYNAAYRKWSRLKAVMYLNTDDPHEDFNHPRWALHNPSDGSALGAYAEISDRQKFQGELG